MVVNSGDSFVIWIKVAVNACDKKTALSCFSVYEICESCIKLAYDLISVSHQSLVLDDDVRGAIRQNYVAEQYYQYDDEPYYQCSLYRLVHQDIPGSLIATTFAIIC